MSVEESSMPSAASPNDTQHEALFGLFKEFFNATAKDVHMNAVVHGWHENPRTVGDLIALAHSELSEALEEIRKNTDPRHKYYREGDGKPEGFGVELADVVIRLMDMAVLYRIDLGAEIVEKMIFNKTRPHRHGGKLL